MAHGDLFARYASPPNALGYCGPADSDALLAASSVEGNPGGLADLAREFKGAWSYLQLIAEASGIADPLDHRVVEAYWVGSRLLESVPAPRFMSSVREHPDARLSDRSLTEEAVRAGGVAHHSFHVFAVYPWLAVLRAGKRDPALSILDRCRISWGRVDRVEGPKVSVWTRPLDFDGQDLVLLDERLEEVRCGVDDLGYVDELAPGDVVSLHWSRVCDRLDPTALEHLEHFSARSLRAANLS